MSYCVAFRRRSIRLLIGPEQLVTTRIVLFECIPTRNEEEEFQRDKARVEEAGWLEAALGNAITKVGDKDRDGLPGRTAMSAEGIGTVTYGDAASSGCCGKRLRKNS